MIQGFITQHQVEKLRDLIDRLEDRGLGEESRALGAFLAEMSPATARLGTAEAAEILGVTQQTVRNWVRAGIVAGGQDATGHFFVTLEALIPALRQRQVVPEAPHASLSDAEVDAEIAAARADRGTVRAKPV